MRRGRGGGRDPLEGDAARGVRLRAGREAARPVDDLRHPRDPAPALLTQLRHHLRRAARVTGGRRAPGGAGGLLGRECAEVGCARVRQRVWRAGFGHGLVGGLAERADELRRRALVLEVRRRVLEEVEERRGGLVALGRARRRGRRYIVRVLACVAVDTPPTLQPRSRAGQARCARADPAPQQRRPGHSAARLPRRRGQKVGQGPQSARRHAFLSRLSPPPCRVAPAAPLPPPTENLQFQEVSAGGPAKEYSD